MHDLLHGLSFCGTHIIFRRKIVSASSIFRIFGPSLPHGPQAAKRSRSTKATGLAPAWSRDTRAAGLAAAVSQSARATGLAAMGSQSARATDYIGSALQDYRRYTGCRHCNGYCSRITYRSIRNVERIRVIEHRKILSAYSNAYYLRFK